MQTIMLIMALFVMSCGGGGGGDNTPSSLVAEQTDYYDGVTYHRYYRYSGLRIGYATSIDGVTFTPHGNNPVFEGAAYPVLVEGDRALYLIIRDMATGEYRLYDVTTPDKPTFIRVVLRGDYCNMAIAVVDGQWHALIEGHDEGYFFLMHSVMEGGEFKSFKLVRGDAGNPTMAYIRERCAILVLYGADYTTTGVWQVRAMVYNFKGWAPYEWSLSEPGVHLADPDLGVGLESNPLIITVGRGQGTVSTYHFAGTKADLYDAIASGTVELTNLGVTMTGQ